MAAKILLVNPAVYDFAAYDFWVKPYGLLSVAGRLRGRADFKLFDYMDRRHPFAAQREEAASDRWGRGRFYSEQITRPPCLSDVPRYYRRFGLPRKLFQNFLREHGDFDFVLVQTMMTYWYPGVEEVIADICRLRPEAKIILGGNYVTLCASHAGRLGADLLVKGRDLQPLWDYLGVQADRNEPALWDVYERLEVGVLKLSDGCPFKCTYCSVPQVYEKFEGRPLERSLAEMELLVNRGVENVAFYDDALLFDSSNVLEPFLNEVLSRNIKVNFHSPNALNARFITRELAELMVRAGFKTFYLGFESSSAKWQKKTGSKVFSAELAEAAENLKSAGAQGQSITAYQVVGHPDSGTQELEASMQFVNSLGIRGMLADFSPIPGTPDGESCRKWVDMDEPLFHNKTAFPIILSGFDEINRLKGMQQRLNGSLGPK